MLAPASLLLKESKAMAMRSVVVDKVGATPPGYPRRVGLPAKRPIA